MIGLCAARLVEHDWRTAVLLIVPALGMLATMRAYAAQRARHGRLEFLYDTSRALSGPADTGDALENMLARSLESFRADTAEIVFFSPDGAQALRTTTPTAARRAWRTTGSGRRCGSRGAPSRPRLDRDRPRAPG